MTLRFLLLSRFSLLLASFCLTTMPAFAIDQKIVQVAGEGDEDLIQKKVMVAVPKATMGADEKIVAVAELGTIMTVARQNAGWLWIADRSAWIERKSVVPVEDALTFFTDQIKATPNAEAFHQRGIAQTALGNDDAALADFDEAIRRDSKISRLFINRGIVWQKKKELSKALSDYNAALKLEPKNGLAYVKRSDLYLAQKEHAKAIADLEVAIKLNPEFAEAYNNLGVCHWAQGEKKRAIEDYSKALDLNPEHAVAYANRGFAYKSTGEYQKSIEDYQQSIHYQPRSPVAYNDLAWLRATCADETFRDGTQAIQLAEQACKMTEYKQANFLDTLAAAHAELGKFPLAVEWVRKAIAIADKEQLPPLEQHLKRYQALKPWRDQPEK